MSIIEALQQKRDEVGTHQLATALGLSESTIRVISNGHYKGNLEAVTTAFNLLYNNEHVCLYTDEIIDSAECLSRASAPQPHGGATKRAWWETCQTCQFKDK